jgi:hypothetical protein
VRPPTELLSCSEKEKKKMKIRSKKKNKKEIIIRGRSR